MLDSSDIVGTWVVFPDVNFWIFEAKEITINPYFI